MEQFPLHRVARDGNVMEALRFSHMIRDGDIELVQALLLYNNGADINIQDKQGWTPLHWAARYGREATVELLLDKGADINIQDKQGWTPLHWAAYNGHEAIVQLLLAKGADASLQNIDGWTPLHYAVLNGYVAIAQLLLAKGANVNLRTTLRGWTPLQLTTTCPTCPGTQNIVQIITDYQQRMQQAEQKAQEITSAMEMALFDESENNQSPLAMLPGDGGQPQILRDIIGLSREAILQEARQQAPTTNSWCIIA